MACDVGEVGDVGDGLERAFEEVGQSGVDDGKFLGVSVGDGDLGGARGDKDETVVGAVVSSGVEDGHAVVDDGDHVDGEVEG